MYIYMNVCMHACVYYLNKTYPSGHGYNSFMATGALGHTHVRLHVVGIQDPKKVQVSTRSTGIIIHTNLRT